MFLFIKGDRVTGNNVTMFFVWMKVLRVVLAVVF